MNESEFTARSRRLKALRRAALALIVLAALLGSGSAALGQDGGEPFDICLELPHLCEEEPNPDGWTPLEDSELERIRRAVRMTLAALLEETDRALASEPLPELDETVQDSDAGAQRSASSGPESTGGGQADARQASKFRELLEALKEESPPLSERILGAQSLTELQEVLTKGTEEKDCPSITVALQEAESALQGIDCEEERLRVEAARRRLAEIEAAMERDRRDREEAQAEVDRLRQLLSRLKAQLAQAQADAQAAQNKVDQLTQAIYQAVIDALSEGGTRELVESSLSPPEESEAGQWVAVTAPGGVVIYWKTGGVPLSPEQKADWAARQQEAVEAAGREQGGDLAEALEEARAEIDEAHKQIAALEAQIAEGEAQLLEADSRLHHRPPVTGYEEAREEDEAAMAALRECERRAAQLRRLVEELREAEEECRCKEQVQLLQTEWKRLRAAVDEAASELARLRANLEAAGGPGAAPDAARAVSEAEQRLEKAAEALGRITWALYQSELALERDDYEAACDEAAAALSWVSGVEDKLDDTGDAVREADRAIAGAVRRQRERERQREAREASRMREALEEFARWLRDNGQHVQPENIDELKKLAEELEKAAEEGRGVGADDVLVDPALAPDFLAVLLSFLQGLKDALGQVTNFLAAILYNWFQAEAEETVREIAEGRDLDIIWARLQIGDPMGPWETRIIQGVGVDGGSSPVSYFIIQHPNGEKLVFKMSQTSGLQLLGKIPAGYSPGSG